MQPEAMLFSKKILPMAVVTDRPSWMRAILRENVDRSVVDLAESRYHSVRRELFLRHAEVGALGLRQHEFFDKAAGIEELVDAVPGGEFTFGALLGDGLGIASDGFLF